MLNNNLRTQDFIIVAKFLTKRALSVKVVIRTFKLLWRSRNGFKVKSVGDHIIFFIFDNKLEVEKILQNELWSFDKHLVVVQYYEKDVLIRELKFERANFLVQVHNLSNLWIVRWLKKFVELLGKSAIPQTMLSVMVMVLRVSESLWMLLHLYVGEGWSP